MIPRHAVGPDREGERGATIVIVTLAMVALLVMVAIVIDLGYTRGGAGFDQSSADLAALAGGRALGNEEYGDACEDIITYVNTNAEGMPAINAASFCSGFEGTTCSGGSTSQVKPTTTSGRYSVSLHFPVPNSEIADGTFGPGKLDGLPCERIRVIVTSQEPAFFGGIAGRSSYTVTRSATVYGGPGPIRLAPSLWLLDPVGCVVLTVQGGSKVIAGDVSDPANINPGIVVVDSNGTTGCSTTNTTITAGGAGTELRAIPVTGEPNKRGEIFLRALPTGATSCTGSVACKPSEVGAQILPQPKPVSKRSTRAPVDWVWNCKTSYPDYLGIPIKGCGATDTRVAYIDRLDSGVGTSGPPPGYQRWTSSFGCSPSGTVTVTGNWWVDCPPPNGLSITNGTTVTFAAGNVVFDGGIKLNSGGFLNVNTANPSTTIPSSCQPPNLNIPCIGTSSSQAAFIYVRNGDWNLGGGTFTGVNTMVHLSNSSVVKGTGGAPPTWSAPTEGPFAGLALWAEAPGAYTISGGAGVQLRGTFFTPYANELTLTGGGNWGQQNAQFISYRLKVTGGSTLSMSPDPASAVILPPVVHLIR